MAVRWEHNPLPTFSELFQTLADQAVDARECCSSKSGADLLALDEGILSPLEAILKGVEDPNGL